jgi:glucose/arabinose dehydrogenase
LSFQSRSSTTQDGVQGGPHPHGRWQTDRGVYEDFMTGFVLDEKTVWGRPVGIAVTRDGALLVSDDANGTIFRITYKASP